GGVLGATPQSKFETTIAVTKFLTCPPDGSEPPVGSPVVGQYHTCTPPLYRFVSARQPTIRSLTPEPPMSAFASAVTTPGAAFTCCWANTMALPLELFFHHSRLPVVSPVWVPMMTSFLPSLLMSNTVRALTTPVVL